MEDAVGWKNNKKEEVSEEEVMIKGGTRESWMKEGMDEWSNEGKKEGRSEVKGGTRENWMKEAKYEK